MQRFAARTMASAVAADYKNGLSSAGATTP